MARSCTVKEKNLYVFMLEFFGKNKGNEKKAKNKSLRHRESKEKKKERSRAQIKIGQGAAHRVQTAAKAADPSEPRAQRANPTSDCGL